MKAFFRKSIKLSYVFLCMMFVLTFGELETYATDNDADQEMILNMQSTTAYCTESVNVYFRIYNREDGSYEWSDGYAVFTVGKKLDVIDENDIYYTVRWTENGEVCTADIWKECVTKNEPKVYFAVVDTCLQGVPTGNFNEKCKIKKNQQVEAFGEPDEDGYYKVIVAGNAGYIHKNLLSGKKNVSSKMYVVSEVEIKDKTNGKGSRFFTGYFGDKLDVIGSADKYGYYKVLNGSDIGYVKKTYLSTKKPVKRYAAYKLSIYKKTGGKGKIAEVQQNEEVTITSSKDSKGYYKVFYKGKSGYAKAEAFTKALVDTAYTQAKINVYSKSNGKGKLATLKANTKVYVMKSEYKADYYICWTSFKENKYGYYKISYKGKTGYIKADFVDEKKGKTRYVNYKSKLVNKKGKKICTLKLNTKVTVVGGKLTSDTVKVIYNGKVGYIEKWRLSGKKVSTKAEKRFSAANVTKKMKALYSKYPEGMHWTNANGYDWKGGTFTTGYGCAGFAFILSDAAFGDIPSRIIYNTSNLKKDLRVGDILRINNNTHSVIIIEKTSTGVVVAEGNYNSSIHWGREFTYAELKKVTDYYMTRYPE